jgi:lysozyme
MFNMGPGTLMGFKNTLQLIHTGQYKPAAAALRTSRYAKQVGARAERLAKLLESVV